MHTFVDLGEVERPAEGDQRFHEKKGTVFDFPRTMLERVDRAASAPGEEENQVPETGFRNEIVAAVLDAEYYELSCKLRFTPTVPIHITLYTNQEFQDVTRAPQNGRRRSTTVRYGSRWRV